MWLSLRTITGKVFLLCLFHFTALSQTVLPGTVPGTIVYSRAGSPNGNVYFASGDGTREVAITEGEQPRLSPDGRFLLFHRDRAPYSQANMYVRDLSNSTQWELADGGSYIVGYDWNLAGDRVIFDYSCDIEIIDRSGANRGGFVGGDCYDDAPSLSRADGTVCFHNIHSGLWLSNANGSNKRFIPSTTPNDVWPIWSPDGQWLAFMNGANFVKIRPDGTGRTNLTSLTANGDTFNPIGAWTPDGSWLVAGGTVLGTNALYAVPTDGSAVLLKMPSPPGAALDWVGNVTTNIDLSKLVDLAVSATSTPNPLLTNSPFTVAIKVGNSAPVAAEGVFVTNQVTAGLQIVSVTTSQGSYSVVGQVIVFNLGSLAGGGSANFAIQEVTTVAGPVTNNVFVTSSSPELVKANNSVVLAGYATQPPAITGMFYSLGGAPDGKVYYSAGDGSPDQFVTNGEEPRLSPDGQYLAFKRGNANYSQASLYLRNLKTGEEKLLYQDNDFLVGYGWTADSSQVFFDYSCAIYAIGVGGANVHPLVSRDCYDDVPAVFAGTGNFVFHNIHSGLWLAGPDGSNVHMIPNTKPGDTWASWSGDGQEILFTDGVNLFKINPDGSDRTQLTFLAAPDGIPQGGQFSPDGKTAFVAGTIGGITGLFAIPTDGTGQATRVPAASGGGVTFVGSVNTTIHVVPLLKILSVTASGAVVIASEPHTNYVLEATPSLNPAQWKPVRTNQATGGTLQLDDPDAAQNLSRFYRVFR